MYKLSLLLLPAILAGCSGSDKNGTTDTTVAGDDTGTGSADDTVIYPDDDGDGYTAEWDCDDNNAQVNPGATEICDGIDNDCNGEVDDGVTTTWYADSDADGYGDATTTTEACTQPDGYVANATDCNDADPAYNPGASETDCSDPNDYNCDGSTGYTDADGDGYAACQECDDSNAADHPGADELCDGVDNDCDGEVDEADAVDGSTWYADRDGDGYGNATDTTTACSAPDGYVADATDCDDTNASTSPGAVEVCDGQDNNCDGLVDEAGAADESTWYTDADGDGYGDPASSTTACDQPAGTSPYGTDCDDTDPAYNPGATETCDDPHDYNCDGSVGYTDADGDGYAACDDCNDADPTQNPAATEICNSADDNCDGLIDNDATDAGSWYADADGDGFGDAGDSTLSCAAPDGFVADATDCDDTDSAISPAAYEVCDGLDNDCDGVLDESDAIDAATWYTDSDGDGYGDDATATLACDAPAGTVALSGDCDDTNAAVSPAAVEVCNSIDDDCDGYIDEAGATGGSTWYADTDGDGYGDSSSTAESCDLPAGYSADDTDCDDSDAAINPGAEEICDLIDNNCDGTVDNSAVDAPTWYRDADKDGYGNVKKKKVQCSKPSGYSSDDTDCLDTNAAVYPGAPEICDGIDDDCDGLIDEDATDAGTWYTDADGDGYGDPSSPETTCTEPSGTTTDDTDCDDTDAAVHPGATEIRDGLDNDCDGEADDHLYLGSGADGDLSVVGTTDLSTDASGSRSVADGISWPVAAISGSTVTVDATVSGLSAGDEVLLIDLHGTDAAYSRVGTYEFANVTSVSGADVTLAEAVTNTYGEVSNSDLSGQAIVLQRVPNYSNVTISSSGVLSTSAWDGSTGGVLALRVSGTLLVRSGGLITADGLGYAGGATGPSYNCDSYQGESYAGAGEGDGDGACSGYNEAYGEWAANYGGGGAHIDGGGGNYGGGATAGDSWTGGSATPPAAGDTYGDSDLSTLFLGSGGGGVWYGTSSCTGSGPGPGGDGAGLIFASAGTITAKGGAAFTALGGSSDHCAQGSWTYGAGGGAGGSVWLVADTVDLAADALDAEGGTGNSSNIRVGGDGGVGRVRIDCTTCNGFSSGSLEATSALEGASEPDPGVVGTP